MPIAFVSAWFCNICYAQSFLHYVNFYVNLVPRSLHQRRRWGEGEKRKLWRRKTPKKTHISICSRLCLTILRKLQKTEEERKAKKKFQPRIFSRSVFYPENTVWFAAKLKLKNPKLILEKFYLKILSSLVCGSAKTKTSSNSSHW